MKTYLNLEDVDQIYIRLRGTDRGINSFNVRVKDVAIKKNGAYIFMDEPALFDFCKEYFKDEDILSAKETLTLNGVSLDDTEINVSDNEITITLDTKVDSIFGKVIRINEYEIKVSRVGTKDKERVIISKKE